MHKFHHYFLWLLFLLLGFNSHSLAFRPTPKDKGPFSRHAEDYFCRLTLENTAQIQLSNEFGPNIYLHNRQPVRDISKLEKLKISAFNFYNLEWHVGKYEQDPSSGLLVKKSRRVKKPYRDLVRIGQMIREEDPDILVGSEIEDIEILEKFAQDHLGGRYYALLIEGNDPRRIDIGFLIKKDLPFDFELQSYRNVTGPYNNEETRIFSRDFPVLNLWPMGADRQQAPFLAIGGLHNKSQRDSTNDQKSKRRRSLQTAQQMDIVDRYLNIYGEKYPFILAGDANAELRRSFRYKEFRPYWTHGYIDSFDLLDPPLPRDERITHSYFPTKKGKYSQLDGILVPGPDVIGFNMVLNAWVVPYKDEEGQILPHPKSKEERRKQPSDHLMVKAEIDFKSIYLRHLNDWQ